MHTRSSGPESRIPAPILLALTLLLVPAVAVAGGAPYGGVDHTRKISRYDGPSTCLGCHSTSKMGSNLAADVYNSAHFQLRTTGSSIDMPGGGAHGMLDRACGLPGTTMMANNYAYTAVGPTGTTRDDGCGKCHVAYKLPLMYPNAASATNDIDCLRCHAEYYGAEWDAPDVMTTFGANPEAHARNVVTMTDASGTFSTWSQDRSQKTAGSVGNLPKSKYCLRCHEHGYTGYKRATPFTPETDAHAAAGVKCGDCHAMQQHRIARGNFVTDMVANDLPNYDLGCAAAACHGSVPHSLTNAAALNRHTTNVRCEACHIPTLPVTDDIAVRAWAPFTLNPLTGAWDDTPATTEGSLYPGLYDAYVELYDKPWTIRYANIADAIPAIRWFDGKASMLAQPSGGYANRRSAGGCSTLFALKPFISGMLFDGGWLENLRDANGTRLYSMKWLYEQSWSNFLAMGFVDAQYPTAGDYWAARADMAGMLDNFPMMLSFDRDIYLSRAGEVVGIPLPGPQTGATYPGIQAAIESGMAAIGATWSGTSFFGMWVPPNMVNPGDPASLPDPRLPLGSFITPSHSIQGAAAMGTPCYSCHMTPEEYALGAAAPEKRAPFAYLGYPDKDANGAVDPMYGDIDRPTEVIPGVGSITMTFTASRKGETLTTVVAIVNPTTSAPLSGVAVTGSLKVPGSTTPVAFSGTTGTAGTVSFAYTQPTLPAGTYAFAVKELAYGGKTYPESCTKSAVK